MNPRPNSSYNRNFMSDETKARLIAKINPNSNVIFVDFKNKKQLKVIITKKEKANLRGQLFYYMSKTSKIIIYKV